jgi:hypothetical protein
METPVLIALLVAVVVAFFGWQWWSASGRRRGPGGGAGGSKTVAGMSVTAEKPLAPTLSTAPPATEERYPEVVGQTEADLRAKEPDQRQPPAGAPRPQPVTADGKGPAAIEDNLRHPEQAFHQPSAAPRPSSAVAAGIASPVSTPGFASTGPSTPPMGGHQQAFAPEMAQNGGAIVGDSMFAFDGMAPTSFAEF